MSGHVQSLLLRASHWTYLGEGASNIVVAYSGDHSPLVRCCIAPTYRTGPHACAEKDHRLFVKRRHTKVCSHWLSARGTCAGSSPPTVYTDCIVKLQVGTVLRLRKRLDPKPGPSFPADADVLVWAETLGVTGAAAREEWQWQYTRRVIVRVESSTLGALRLPTSHLSLSFFAVCRRFVLRLHCAHAQVPLIGRSFVDAGDLVPINPDFVESLSRLVAPLRPAHRAAHSLDPSARFALLLPNYASPDRTLSGGAASTSAAAPSHRKGGAYLSVEIKPKCGFLPKSDAVCPVGGALKRASSRFQLHQYLKVKSGKYSKVRDLTQQHAFELLLHVLCLFGRSKRCFSLISTSCAICLCAEERLLSSRALLGPRRPP